jgi:hypothetical protein
LTIIWEHGHAYQPRRIVDAILIETRHIPGGVRRRINGRVSYAENWFELMLRSGGAYDTMVDNLETRSIDFEPLTLFHLARLNPEAHKRLWQLVAEGRIGLFPSAYSHPILPLMASESFFDAKTNVEWGVQYVLGNGHNPQGSPVFFWLSECAYNAKAAQAILDAIREVRPSAQVFLLLDEFQGENIDASHPYRLRLETGEVGLVFRSRWVSDAYAFSQDSEWLIQSLRADILRRRPDLVGAAVDAETYGGAYDASKPFFFARIREGLGKEVSGGNVTVPVRFLPVDQALQAASTNGQEAKLLEGSSWSNYVESQLLHPQSEARTGVLARSLGPLCRWTGLVPRKEGGRQETYFMVYDWVDPLSKEWYTRVVSSLWKVAFNALRTRGCSLVRRTVLDVLPPLLGIGSIEEALTTYGEVIFETMSWGSYASRFRIGRTQEEQEAANLLLEAYRMADQEAWMSDPTYWENMDTEVTWTALALLAAGIIQAAKACLKLGEERRFEELADGYKTLFLDFEASFRTLSEEYGCPLDVLYQYLREQSLRRGYDLEQDLASSPSTEEQARTIAERAYEATFNKDRERPLRESDVNPYLILWRMKELRGSLEDARQAWKRACAREWEKSIASVVSKKPTPVRVGLLHAKHFPENKAFTTPLEDPEIDTEIISGEAHAYL